MAHDNDYHIDDKIKIQFEGMPYWVMPRYMQHYVYNEYEPFSLKIIKNNLDETTTLLDIGAHYGAYSIYAAKKCDSSVIALEPVDENHSILTENIKINNLENKIITHNVAASSEDGVAEFNIPWASDSAGFYNHPLADTYKTQKVIVKNVDGLVKGKKIDFVKIDTEGHELTVLEGLKDTLKFNPGAKLLVEANPACLKVAGHTVYDLLSVLSNVFDKEVYVVDEKLFTMYRLTDRIDRWQEYISEDGYANIYCVPKKGHQYSLYICHSTQFGGAELAMVEQIESLRKKGVISHVVVPYAGNFENMLKDKGIGNSVITYSFWDMPKANSAVTEHNQVNINASAQITSLSERLNPTIVVNNSMVCPWGYPAAKVLNLPLVWLIHEFGDLDHHIKFQHIIKNIREFIVDSSDLVICCSDSVKNVMHKAKPNNNIHTIYGAINSRKIQECSTKEVPKIYSANTDLKLICVGRVSESKGQIVAIRAVHMLIKKGILVELALVGPVDLKYKNILKKEINNFNLNGVVKILGYKENPHAYVKQADILLVCSENEAFGRVTAEAMILETPVIGTSSGGTTEMIKDNETGLLFKPSDANDLSNKILKMKNISNIEKMKYNAKKMIFELINEDKNVSKLLKLISSINHKDSSSNVFLREWVDAVNCDTRDIVILRTEINDLKNKIMDLETEILSIRKENSEIELQRNNILESKSWKITKPIREGSRLAHKIKAIKTPGRSESS